VCAAEFPSRLGLSTLSRRLHAPGSVIGTYVHGAMPDPSSTKVGRMGAIVTLVAQPEAQSKHGAELSQLAVGLAMHVVASRPVYVSKEHVPQQERDRRLEALRNEVCHGLHP
jgi:translation elongation factor EF-Ts